VVSRGINGVKTNKEERFSKSIYKKANGGFGKLDEGSNANY
jgi:hypothetical protein